jgi:hypothetical protein
MNDEWRVEVDLDDEQHGYSLGERLRSLPLDEQAKDRLGGRAIVTRDGGRMFVYTADGDAAAEAHKVLRELLDEDDLTAELRVTRYHPLEGAWKDASEPLPASEEEERAEYERKETEARRSGELEWEVRVDLHSLEDAVAAEKKLADQGLPVHRRWRHVIAGVPTEEAANELAGRLRSDLPNAEEISVDPHDLRYPVFMLLGASY